MQVATEVAKKKFNSEEETWSDQSVLIFYNNLEVGRWVADWRAVCGSLLPASH
jgi:hypothetical protein